MKFGIMHVTLRQILLGLEIVVVLFVVAFVIYPAVRQWRTPENYKLVAKEMRSHVVDGVRARLDLELLAPRTLRVNDEGYIEVLYKFTNLNTDVKCDIRGEAAGLSLLREPLGPAFIVSSDEEGRKHFNIFFECDDSRWNLEMDGWLPIVPRDAKVDYTIPILQLIGSVVVILVTELLRRRSQV